MAVIVGKHINDITINPLEYLLNDAGDIMEFASKNKAIEFLKEKGYTDDDVYWLTFKKINKKNGKEVII